MTDLKNRRNSFRGLVATDKVKQVEGQKTAGSRQLGKKGGGVTWQSDVEEVMMLHWAAGTNCTSVLQRDNNGYRRMSGGTGVAHKMKPLVKQMRVRVKQGSHTNHTSNKKPAWRQPESWKAEAAAAPLWHRTTWYPPVGINDDQMVLQWCYSGVGVMSQWCYSGLQWCCSGVAVLLQRCGSIFAQNSVVPIYRDNI
jgi:hypothetical protein